LDTLNWERSGNFLEYFWGSFLRRPSLDNERRRQMKRVLVVVCMALAVMAVSMMGGCASQKPIDSTVFFVSSEAGASKTPISLGESTDGGFMVGGTEGASRKGISLGEPKDGGFFADKNEGASKPGLKW
jgi:hypothetical protein